MTKTIGMYKCRYCGKRLISTWVDHDMDKDIAGFVNGRFYDVCIECEEVLGLVSKLKHSEKEPYCLVSRW